MLTHSIVASGPWVRRAIFLVPVAATLMLFGVIAAGGGLAMPAQAQSGSGAVPNLRLSSASPGQLTITWDAPDPAPSDYRVIWAKQGLDFLSYKATNEANRGNEYPSGDETSITLTGLAKGATFKVQSRARYTSGGDNDGPWSGPWTDTVTTRVKDDPPAAPTGLTASQVAHDSVTVIGTFASADTNYTYSTDQFAQNDGITVTAATQNGATWTIDPPDADPNTAGHQIHVDGDDTIVVTVTSQDGLHQQTYTIAPAPD